MPPASVRCTTSVGIDSVTQDRSLGITTFRTTALDASNAGACDLLERTNAVRSTACSCVVAADTTQPTRDLEAPLWCRLLSRAVRGPGPTRLKRVCDLFRENRLTVDRLFEPRAPAGAMFDVLSEGKLRLGRRWPAKAGAPPLGHNWRVISTARSKVN